MNILKSYINYLHLKKEEIRNVEVKNYKKVKKIEVARLHLCYLKEQIEFQRGRQTNIENKNAQLVGQASIIVSIITLFIPLILDKLSDLHTSLFIILVFGFTFILIHYLFAIIHAIKTLQINHYPYSSRSTRTVTKSNRATTEANFLKEEIEDLIWSIEKNAIQNNRKGDNLIYATRSFRIATIGLVIFAVCIIAFGSMIPPANQGVDVKSVDKSTIKEMQKVFTEEVEKNDAHLKLKEERNEFEKKGVSETDSVQLVIMSKDSLDPI